MNWQAIVDAFRYSRLGIWICRPYESVGVLDQLRKVARS